MSLFGFHIDMNYIDVAFITFAAIVAFAIILVTCTHHSVGGDHR